MLKSERNTASPQRSFTVAHVQRHQYFQNLAICKVNSDCTGEYTYCHRGRCRCWPEFRFVLDHPSILFNNSTSISSTKRNNNQTGSSYEQKYNAHGFVEDYTNNNGINNNVETELGYCVRKICQLDSQCRTVDNPNLVCNNTICECRYSYIMYKETKVCMKYVLRRQSCDLTCRIIGGLFASIFMLTLIYWCFYCCYSIVKNYRNRRRYQEPSFYPNLYPDFDSFEAYFSTNSLTRTSNRSSSHNHSNTSRFPINLPALFRFPMTDDPPSYSQAMADETLPDYDAVMELQELRKTEDVGHKTD